MYRVPGPNVHGISTDTEDTDPTVVITITQAVIYDDEENDEDYAPGSEGSGDENEDDEQDDDEGDGEGGDDEDKDAEFHAIFGDIFDQDEEEDAEEPEEIAEDDLLLPVEYTSSLGSADESVVVYCECTEETGRGIAQA